jgi:PhnB protein
MSTTGPTIIPYMLVRGAAAAIEYYRKVFGAEESGARFTDPSGRIGHAEITIGDSKIMLADENEAEGYRFSPFMFYVKVADASTVTERAVAEGGALVRAVQDQAYGERSGVVRDPFGHSWMVSQPVEEVSREELQARVGAQYKIS